MECRRFLRGPSFCLQVLASMPTSVNRWSLFTRQSCWRLFIHSIAGLCRAYTVNSEHPRRNRTDYGGIKTPQDSFLIWAGRSEGSVEVMFGLAGISPPAGRGHRAANRFHITPWLNSLGPLYNPSNQLTAQSAHLASCWLPRQFDHPP